MKEFNFKEKCSKCGGEEILTFYCKGSRWGWECSFTKVSEHLHRKCERCKYEWAEKCVRGETYETSSSKV